jgi:hypothetical protein
MRDYITKADNAAPAASAILDATGENNLSPPPSPIGSLNNSTHDRRHILMLNSYLRPQHACVSRPGCPRRHHGELDPLGHWDG